MKRLTSAALCVVLGALCLLAGPTRAQAAPHPGQFPQLVRPDLFEGFEPIEPDQFGVSPSFQFFVFQDQDGLHVIRLFDGEETFTLSFPDGQLTVGFDPADQRLFLLEPRAGGQYRFLFVNPWTGDILRTDFMSVRPRIRTNFDATVNVLLIPDRSRTSVLVFDDLGDLIYRRTYSALVRVALNLFSPVVAFIDAVAGGRVRIDLLNALRGSLVYQSTVSALSRFGFAPFGGAFVIAEPTGPNAFRVRLLDPFLVRALLFRSFVGQVNAGFTPDGSLLGIFSDRARTRSLYLFRTFDGRLVTFR